MLKLRLHDQVRRQAPFREGEPILFRYLPPFHRRDGWPFPLIGCDDALQRRRHHRLQTFFDRTFSTRPPRDLRPSTPEASQWRASELVRCHIWSASSLAASTAMSMARVASGDRVRPAGQCRYISRAGDGRSWWMLSRSSDKASDPWRASHGSTAEPMPARTIDKMAVVAGGSEHDPWPCAVAGERPLQPSLVIGGRPGDHRSVVEQLHPYRTIGERAGAGHQEVRLVEQLDVLDVAFDPAVVEQQVEISDLRILRFHLGQPDVAAGVLVQQPAHDGRQDQVGHALEGADVDPAVTRPEAIDGVGQRLRFRQQIAAVGQDHLAEGSDPYRPGTSGPVEDGATERPAPARRSAGSPTIGCSRAGPPLARTFLPRRSRPWSSGGAARRRPRAIA